jgi:hypothetical protein
MFSTPRFSDGYSAMCLRLRSAGARYAKPVSPLLADGRDSGRARRSAPPFISSYRQVRRTGGLLLCTERRRVPAQAFLRNAAPKTVTYIASGISRSWNYAYDDNGRILAVSQ